MIGDCGAESLLWSLPASFWNGPGLVRRIRAVCQSLSKSTALFRAYDLSSHTPPDELPERILDLINDARFAWPTECLAASAKRARGGHGVWRYVFDQEGPSRALPHHAVDLLYLFDNVPIAAASPVDAAQVDVRGPCRWDADADERCFFDIDERSDVGADVDADVVCDIDMIFGARARLADGGL